MDERGFDISNKIDSRSGIYSSGDRHSFPDDNDTVTDYEELKFAINLDKIFHNASQLLLSKHNDYGPKNISLSPGGPLNGLRVRMWDKIARINNLIDSGKNPEHEALRDSFIDLMNYSAIALMVIDKTWPELPNE